MLLQNGTICDHKQHKKADIRIQNGIITEIQTHLAPHNNEEIYDCHHKVILPALIDMAYPKNKTLSLKILQTLGQKALSGGIGTIILRPDTTPKIDSEAMIEFIHSFNSTSNIQFIPCVSPIKDNALNTLSTLVSNGARAIVVRREMDNYTLYKISQYASMLEIPLIASPQDLSLSDGVIDESELSFELGLPGVLGIAQTIEVATFSELARFSRIELVFDAITERQSFCIIEEFKKMGAKLITQTPIHHLLFTHKHCSDYDTRFKLFPPLKDEDTRAFLIQNLNSSIDMLTSLQSDTYKSAKDQVFENASFGINAFAFYFALGYEFLVKPKIIDLSRFSYLTSYAQAKLFGLNKGEISEGRDADLIIVDLDSHTFVKDAFNPYDNQTLQSQITGIFLNGVSINPNNPL
ncbi:amidohydrolase family protein [Helicobacter fennelliae]|uniref:amidohydrolase family protein n=1 Tax=Helicobacter fennelliae TaxID=215 RepID=UPI000E0682F3|nr:amidohydrolase family protein [Helicobacter fennelliae]STQ85166.1 dihydroorotase [Helicobacter fennelliae]